VLVYDSLHTLTVLLLLMSIIVNQTRTFFLMCAVGKEVALTGTHSARLWQHTVANVRPHGEVRTRAREHIRSVLERRELH
jgi:hypothetical protein